MKIMTYFAILALALTVNGFAKAGSIENLERERALLVDTFLDPEFGPAERQAKITALKPRLIDLERMVIRDDSLTGRNTPIVRKAFANYELTFLMDASIAAARTAFDIWMKQIGLTSDALLSAKIGRKY